MADLEASTRTAPSRRPRAYHLKDVFYRYPDRMAPTSGTPAPQELARSQPAAEDTWCVVVHDDPINTMDYVTWVFHSYFSLPLPLAEHRMIEVHTRGRAVLARGTRERMEVHVTAMHTYGLRATIEAVSPGSEAR